MKFKALTVRNFQRHKKLALEFSPTITTLVGSTDSGKSALLRALRWVCLNDFVGSDFIREGCDVATVQILFRHQKVEHQLTRAKGERVNTYDLNGNQYKSFATNVPEDVARSLQLNEINFQGQHDAPFWFTETAGEVSRRLNAVVDLSVIDVVLSTAASVVRESEGLVRASEQRLADIDQDQLELNPKLARISQYERLKQKHEAHEKQNKDTDYLEAIVSEGCSYSERLVYFRTRILSADALQKRMAQWLQRDREQSTLAKLLSRLDGLQRTAQPPAFDVISTAYQSARSTQQKLQSLEALVGEIAEVEQTIKTATEKSRMAALVFHRATKNERCPLCQNPV